MSVFKTPFVGGCLCGAVRYAASAAPTTEIWAQSRVGWARIPDQLKGYPRGRQDQRGQA